MNLRPKSRHYETRPCPHCERQLRLHDYEVHTSYCPCGPAMRPRLLARLSEISCGGRMPSQNDWEFYHADLPSVVMIVRCFGSWNNFAEWAGYTPNSSGGRTGLAINRYDPSRSSPVTLEEIEQTLPGGLSVYCVREHGQTVSYLLR